MVVERNARRVTPRDAAFDALTVFTREAYERDTHRNNAEATLEEAHADGHLQPVHLYTHNNNGVAYPQPQRAQTVQPPNCRAVRPVRSGASRFGREH